ATSQGMPIVVAIHSKLNGELPFYLAARNQEQFGFIELSEDADNVFRRQQLVKKSEDGEEVPSFALRIAALSMATSIERNEGRLLLANEPIPLEPGDHLRISFRKRPARIERFSFHEVLARVRASDKAFLSRSFKNKIVLIGTEGFQEDSHLAPISSEAGLPKTPGVEIHAQTILTLLDRDFIHEASSGFALAITAALAALLTFLYLRTGPWTGLVLSLVLACAVVAAGVARLRLNQDISLMQPLFGIPLCYAAVFIYRFRVEFRNRWRIQRIFGQYLPEPVVREIADSLAEEQVLGGTKQHITVLFSDIRDFTTLTEQLRPEALVPQLNEYLSAMTDVILAHKGIVDKFIGDGILALFGTPISSDDHAASAVQAAVSMLDELNRLNRVWEAKGWPALKIGIGIHTGYAIVGNIGSSRKMEYTALGDTVNVASRVEGQTKKHRIPLLMTDTTADCLDGRWDAERVGSELLKGKTESTTLYGLRSMIPH
ncbi:MAG: adenylate/guanylate cyclase domain-containing protein, partial [Acidobacteria bacterium]|nr:adenylate/guanylate cyclase domain-containing protein [Acidobacteriota bacterium]